MGDEKRAGAQRLERGLGLLDATTIVVGSMIGSGIFIVSAESSRLTGAPGWLLAAWALAGLLTILGALSCAELAAMMPRAGGQYVFLREAYGPAWGFLFGWSLLLVIQTGTIAAVAVAFANFVGVLWPQVSGVSYIVEPLIILRPFAVGPLDLGLFTISRSTIPGYALSLSTQQLVAVVMILFLTFTNTLGLKVGKWIQNVFTFTKTGALAALIVLGLAFGTRSEGAAFTSAWWDSWANGWTPEGAQAGIGVTGSLALVMLLGRAMVGPLFAQSAWNNVTFTAGEVRDPGRTLPRALLLGCGLVVALYLLANLAYVTTLPFAAIQNAPQNRVATAAMQAIFGAPGTVLMAVAIIISTFGCNNGLVLAGARVYYAMARDNLFFERVGSLNAKHVPAVALVAQGLWASLLTLPRTVSTDPRTGAAVYGNVYTQLLEYIISADLVFYALMVAAVIVLRRKRPDAVRPYRTHGYPFVPVLYVLLAALVVLDLAYLAPATSGIGYLIVLTGIPAYFLWRGRTGRAGAGDGY